jgi:hypothetical protein
MMTRISYQSSNDLYRIDRSLRLDAEGAGTT